MSGSQSTSSQESKATKVCPKCEQSKTLSEFGKDKTKKFGVSAYCKSCANENRKTNYKKSPEKEKEKLREYYAKNKSSFRKYSLKALYGLSEDQFEDMKHNQDYACKICRTHEKNLKRGLFVDHCHETNRVRGLLCQSCNTMLGNAKDNILVLQAGIAYLSGKT
jgi:hypothetical protein